MTEVYRIKDMFQEGEGAVATMKSLRGEFKTSKVQMIDSSSAKDGTY